MRFQVTTQHGQTRIPSRWSAPAQAGHAGLGLLSGPAGGFTLIENLLTLSMMMFTMLALVGLLGAVINANATNKKHTIAMALVESKIAEVRRLGYNSAITADTTVTEPYNSGSGTALELYPIFKRVTFTKVETPASGMQTVTVTVYWDQDRRSVSKNTLVAQ
jgi:type II secretory pathway pseudopilin PulG